MTTDPLTLLRQADPARAVAPYDATRAAALVKRAISAPAPAPSRPRWRRPSRTVGAALTATLLASGAAYAAFRQPATRALMVSCAVGSTKAQFVENYALSSVLNTTSGDPVADCADEYQRLEGAVPDLRGYSTGQSFITVVPADWPVPPEWQPLTTTFRSDAARVELESRLDDQIEGPAARCRDSTTVEALVRKDLADLGLSGWTVSRLSEATKADGRTWCAVAFPAQGGEDEVLVQGVEAKSSTHEAADDVRMLIDTLRREVAEQCVTLAQAQAASEQAVQAASFALTDAKITALEDSAASCTRVDFVPAGLITINLRGPAR